MKFTRGLFHGLFIAAALAAAAAAPAAAQDVSVNLATRPDNGHVLLVWTDHPAYGRYNIYRRRTNELAYPAQPLNPAPVELLSDCGELSALIPEGSADWQMIQTISGDPGFPFDPCALGSVLPGGPEYERLQFLARSNPLIARAIGQGFLDETAELGLIYLYRIRGVDAGGAEGEILANNLLIESGSPPPIDPPANFEAQPGDARVLLTWDASGGAAGYEIQRALNAGGPYRRVNPSTVIAEVQADVNGDPLVPPGPGFMDYKRWDGYGEPATHTVAGAPVSGPHNGVTYYYRAAPVDLFGRPGESFTPVVQAQPVDQTPPMTPQEIVITPSDPLSEIEIRWQVVRHDVNGRREDSIQGYQLTRHPNPETPEVIDQAGFVAQPADGDIQYATAIDDDPNLRPPYGEQSFYYRVQTIDGAGNLSGPSALAEGHLSDITPPDHPQGVEATGFEEFIRVSWDLNAEPDMDGYEIYRSLCDWGGWVCEDFSKHIGPDPVYDPGCVDEFKLIGYLSQTDAIAIQEETGDKPFFDDASVPDGSPVCYAYLVKALDQAQNMNGWLPPNPFEETIVCQRLRETTPPEPAVITAMRALAGEIELEWIGAPVQDIAAYHVYRATEENGLYQFVGGMTAAIPPEVPMLFPDPYVPPPVVSCDEIGLVINETVSYGKLPDTKIEAKRIYWYKVTGIDVAGNESGLSDAIPVSTFTFGFDRPPKPEIVLVEETQPDCDLRVEWTPAFDPELHEGFMVLRSSESANGPYREISHVVQQNEFVDRYVARGETYWYKVLTLGADGTMSVRSDAAGGMAAAAP